jgi:hypothetical protein
MPLLTGNWNLSIDGYNGTLAIEDVSKTGDVVFHLSIPAFGVGVNLPTGRFRSGFWDESSQTITLHAVEYKKDADPTFLISLAFEGYQFPTPVEAPPGQDVIWTLSGSCSAIGLPPANVMNQGHIHFTPTARRHRFGWRAQLGQAL